MKMAGKTGDGRYQKRKISAKQKLWILLILTLLLLLAAIFAESICPYDPNMQNYDMAHEAAGRGASLRHRPVRERYAFQSDHRRADKYFFRIAAGADHRCDWNDCGSALRIRGRRGRYGAHAGLGCLSGVSGPCLCACDRGGVKWRRGNAILALAAISWPKYARLARSQTLAVKKAAYISAARLAGDSPFQIIVRHILPNIRGQILVTAMLDVGTMMMEMAALSFLGLGANPRPQNGAA